MDYGTLHAHLLGGDAYSDTDYRRFDVGIIKWFLLFDCVRRQRYALYVQRAPRASLRRHVVRILSHAIQRRRLSNSTARRPW